MIKKLLQGLQILLPHVEDDATVTLDESGNIATAFEGEMKILLTKTEQDSLKELGWKQEYSEKDIDSVEERAWIYPLS